MFLNSRSILNILILMLAGVAAHGASPSALVFMKEQGESKVIQIKYLNEVGARTLDLPTTFSLYPNISADGKHIAFVGGETLESLDVYVHNLTTKSTQKISDKQSLVLHPSFSKDFKFLVYSFLDNVTQRQLVAVVNMSTLSEKVYDFGGSVYFPRLSSDGKFFVYQKNQDGVRRVYYRSRNEGSAKEHLLSLPDAQCMAPTIDFQNTKVAFTCSVRGLWNIYEKSLVGDTVRPLTFTHFQDFAPTYSSAGQLYFASNRSGNFEIYRLEKNCQQCEAPMYKTVKVHGGSASYYSPSLSF